MLPEVSDVEVALEVGAGMMWALEMEAGAVLVLGIPTCGARRPGPGKRALQPRDMASAGTWEVRTSGSGGRVPKRRKRGDWPERPGDGLWRACLRFPEQAMRQLGGNLPSGQVFHVVAWRRASNLPLMRRCPTLGARGAGCVSGKGW